MVIKRKGLIMKMKSFMGIVLFLLVLIGVIIGVSMVNNAVDHSTFKRVDNITVLYASDFPVFAPKGSFLLGDASKCIEIDSQMVGTSKISEGKIQKETLIRTNSKCVIYFEGEKEEAHTLLNN